MKKTILLGLVALFAISATLVVTSCDKDDNPINCTQLLLEISAASSTYTLDATTENCNAYKDAIQDYLDDCDVIQTQVDHYQGILDELDCSQ